MSDDGLGPGAGTGTGTGTAIVAEPLAAAAANTSAAPGPEAGTPRRDFKLPELRDLGLSVPRPVRAATALLGMGRQRLALVVGISMVGARQVVDSAGRDAQAVSAALRNGGFIVMLREDLGGADLRAALKEFHDRLQPGGIGFVYFAGLGAQVQGQNLLLPRDSVLDTSTPLAERQAQWLKSGVPLSDVVDALMGPADSPRLLVVDAAYQNAALNALPAAGLAAQRLPPGMMAMYGHPLGKVQDVSAVGALSSPPPTDARELAASPFARALVGQLLAPRRRAPDVLRATHRSLYDGSLGQNDVWIAGHTDNEELAEASLLDVIPRTPEELAREAASQAARALTRHTASGAATSVATSATTGTAAAAATAGEQSVVEVLERAPKSTVRSDLTPSENMRASSARNAVADTPPASPAAETAASSAPSSSSPLAPPSAPPSAPTSAPTSTPPAIPPAAPSSTPSLPDVPRPPSSLMSTAASAGSALSTAAGVVGSAASVAGTVASVATTAATVAVVAKATEAAAAVSVATTALSTAGSVAGQMMALAVRSVSSSAAEPRAAAAVQQLATARSAPAAAGSVAVQATAPAAAATTAGRALAAAAPAATAAAAPIAAPVSAPFAAPIAPSAAPPLLPQAAPARPVLQGALSEQATLATQAARIAQAPSAEALGRAAESVPLAPAAAAPGGTALAGAPPAVLSATPPAGIPPAAATSNLARTSGTGGASAPGGISRTGELPVEQFGASAPPASAPPLPSPVARAAQLARADTGPDGRTVRNANGGERPSYAPRTNSYGYAEGDTYTYQVLDTWKDEVINRYTTSIEEVLPDGQMLANSQQMLMDAQGRLKKLANADGSVSSFEPSQDLWWSNPKLGESRDLRFTETVQRSNGRTSEVEWKGSTSVGKVRKIETPAGEFDVLPIESSGWAYEVLNDGMRSTKWSRTVWYSPKLGHPVAIDIEDADRLGKLLKRERVELLHAQASRAATP